MTRNRIISTVVGTTALAIGIAAFAAVSGTDESQAAKLAPATQQAAVSNSIRDAVKDSIDVPGSLLAPGAADAVQHLFTPADRDLPAFFTIPTKVGGKCIVTSSTVISSCLGARGSRQPGTVTIADDSAADTRPPFVYGLILPTVKSVEVLLGTETKVADLGGGFYVLELDSSAATVDTVESVTFVLANGERVTRNVNN